MELSHLIYPIALHRLLPFVEILERYQRYPSWGAKSCSWVWQAAIENSVKYLGLHNIRHDILPSQWKPFGISKLIQTPISTLPAICAMILRIYSYPPRCPTEEVGGIIGNSFLSRFSFEGVQDLSLLQNLELNHNFVYTCPQSLFFC